MSQGRSWAREGARRGRPSLHDVVVAARRLSSAGAQWIATRGAVEMLQEGTRDAERAGARCVANGAGVRRTEREE